MTISKTAKASLPARFGVTLTLATAALVATAGPSSAAAVSVTATPSTGAVSTVVALTTTTANTFKTAGGTLKIANTSGTVDKNAVIFSTAACAAAAGAIPTTTRTVTDGTTATSTTITSATANFQAGDVGKAISGGSIPAGATITARASATSITISAAATATATGLPLAIGAAAGPFEPASITVVSGTKMVVKAPSLMTAGAYNVCVYDTGAGAAAQVMAKSTYTVYAAPTVNSVTPSSGPTAGGTAVTIDGTGFTSKTTATIGGVALPVKLATGSTTTLTATVPAHGPGAVSIVVTTEGGPASAVTYTYKDGITVTPQTMVGNDNSSTATQILDVTGAGFNDFTFDESDATATRLTDNKSHVFLIQADDYSNASANDKAECRSVIVISDLELICTLDPVSTVNTPTAAPKNGPYQVVIVQDATASLANNAATYRHTIVTSGSAFTVAPY